MSEILAYGTMIVTLVLTMSRPVISSKLHIGPGVADAFGVGVMLAAQIVTLTDFVRALHVLWQPFLTLLSMMLTTTISQKLGILDYLVTFLEPHEGDGIVQLFRSVFLFSVVASTFLNNDAAVLLLTPVIVSLIRRNYPSRPDLVNPFAFAVFSAAGVAPLVISNPMNLVVAQYSGIGFNEYALRMLPISIGGWITAYAVLSFVFSKQLRLAQPHTSSAAEPRLLGPPAKQFLEMLMAAFGSFPLLSYSGAPVWTIPALSAAFGVWLCWHHHIAPPLVLAKTLSWEILIFLFCLFVMVLGLQNVGFVNFVRDLYGSVSDSSLKTTLIAGVSAVGSAILNNHPMAILNMLALGDQSQSKLQNILAALIGGDLGPRLLPTGSLAGLLWLEALRKQGVNISAGVFIRVGVAVTVPALAVSLAILFLQSRVFPFPD